MTYAQVRTLVLNNPENERSIVEANGWNWELYLHVKADQVNVEKKHDFLDNQKRFYTRPYEQTNPANYPKEQA